MIQTWKVFFSCALGAGTGAFIGLDLTHAWWGSLIAAVLGFLVGYPAYDFKVIAMAIPKALRHAYDNFSEWQPDREAWKIRFEIYAYWVLWIASIAACWWMILRFRTPSIWHMMSSDEVSADLVMLALLASGIGLLAALLLMDTFGSCPHGTPMWDKLSRIRMIMKTLSLVCNPIPWFCGIIIASQPVIEQTAIAVGSFILRWARICAEVVALIGTIYVLFRYGKFAMHFCRIFIAEMFQLTHSDLRLLCGVGCGHRCSRWLLFPQCTYRRRCRRTLGSAELRNSLNPRPQTRSARAIVLSLISGIESVL